MESPVERIISAVQEQREALKELKAKLREADAKNQELQLNTKQLYENMEELQRQLVEASAESKFACTLVPRSCHTSSSCPVPNFKPILISPVTDY